MTKRMHTDDVMRYMRDDTHLNRVRKIFSSESARIEQAAGQRVPLGPIELRRMEFEAVRRIAAEMGVKL